MCWHFLFHLSLGRWITSTQASTFFLSFNGNNNFSSIIWKFVIMVVAEVWSLGISSAPSPDAPNFMVGHELLNCSDGMSVTHLSFGLCLFCTWINVNCSFDFPVSIFVFAGVWEGLFFILSQYILQFLVLPHLTNLSLLIREPKWWGCTKPCWQVQDLGR